MKRYRTIALLLCFLFGWFGIHHFYLRRYLLGTFYFIFCWSYIPAILSFYDLIRLIFIKQRKFSNAHNRDIEGTENLNGLMAHVEKIEKKFN
jgi:TM2 domain-containing membrane protein YozV